MLPDKISIQIPNTKTHTPRAFLITDIFWLTLIKQYLELRQKIDHEKLFLQMRAGKITKQPYGHNSLSQFPKKIASFLKLPNENSFTGHCFRRTAATLLINNGGDLTQLKRLGGWKSSTVAEGYIDSSEANQLNTAKIISNESTSSGSLSSASSSATKFSLQQNRENQFSISADEKSTINISVSGHDHSNIVINFHSGNI